MTNIATAKIVNGKGNGLEKIVKKCELTKDMSMIKPSKIIS